MHFRSILSGTLAIFLLSGAAAHARDGIGIDLPKIGLPGVFGSKTENHEAPIQLAQAGDPRVTTLEEEIRKLNGSIEELNFQILQMQEQMRKMQEDNEFRFQELEGGGQKKSDASGTTNNSSIVEAPTAPQSGQAQAAAPATNGQSVEDVIVDSGTGEPGTTIEGGGTGAPPRTFGTITVDKNGNVVSDSIDQQAATPAQPQAPAAAQPAQPKANGTAVAALPSTDDPDELYRNSYQFVLSGDYTTAEEGFRDHIQRFPADPKTADARFWLGESLLGQKKYRDAAEIFLSASKEYPKSKKAPEMMLKLGVSLVGLKQREVACATFGEIGKRYPNVSGAIKERVKQERALAAC
ncbi:tol-pal system protein YbgF [Aminobacter aganoensis]|uniref:Cell division coordinator CpoB n=1 Tax=Aminobacter aganoensis TaxID=83264 RepID=A0A7X0FAG8_9HYPH|nr:MULTISPECIES: tol-pal system protein YbgF [Aminobacter]KQU72953.1 tol-pal system protein [Aminobacter sp. DSM 101952]MBB6356109.1 tol-pal system protein YbgF [Aminobacter aganoensis]